MTKKNLGVEATYRVLGKELTHSEALELHKALGSVLNIQPVYQYWPYNPRPWYTSNLIGTSGSNDLTVYGSSACTNLAGTVTTSDSLMEQAAFKSDMVEVIQ